MDAKQIIKLFLRRWWLFVTLAVIAGTATFYINFYVLAPVYEATATVFVNDKSQNSTQYGIAYDQVLVNQMLIADYAEIISSRTIGKAVVEDLGTDELTPEDVLGMITVTSRNNTRIMELTATSTDPELAMRVANSLSNVFSLKAKDLMNVPNVNIIDPAELPEFPIGPHGIRNTFLAVFAAMLLAAGIILVIEYLDNTIKTPEDVENRLGLTVLGTIPEFRMR